jgi:hypothetical protein
MYKVGRYNYVFIGGLIGLFKKEKCTDKLKFVICVAAITMILLSGCNTQNSAKNVFLENEFEIENQTVDRSQLSVEEALNGFWIEENETVIRFKDAYFIQGEALEHVFRYEVKETGKNELNLNLFGVEGFMVKDHNLFNLYLVLDETRTQMIMQKDIGGRSFVYHMVYLDADGVESSYFDTPFFSDCE